MTWKLLLALGAVLVLAALAALRGQPTAALTDPLDQVLLPWNAAGDVLSVRGFLDGGGLAAFGRAGGGKTSALETLAEAAVGLRAPNGPPVFGGVIFCAAPGDKAMWLDTFARAGRSDDVMILEPGGNVQINLLDFLLRRGTTTREITDIVMTGGQVLSAGDGKGGDDGEYWFSQGSRLCFNTVEAQRIGDDKLDPLGMKTFINGMAMTPEDFNNQQFRGGNHYQTLQRAYQRSGSLSPERLADWELCREFWGAEIPGLNDRTKSSIASVVNNVLHVFSTGQVRHLLATATTFDPEAVFRGKFLLVCMPVNTYGSAGKLVNVLVKLLIQHLALKREVRPGDPVCLLWEDESPQVTTVHDGAFASQSRKFLTATVKIGQNLPAYYAALGGSQKGKYVADALLAGFAHKLIFALGDVETPAWAQKLIGNRMQTDGGGSWSPRGPMDGVLGYGNLTSSFNEHIRPVREARDFTTGLRTGGPQNDWCVDCYVIRSGLPFIATGDNWIRTYFVQRHS